MKIKLVTTGGPCGVLRYMARGAYVNTYRAERLNEGGRHQHVRLSVLLDAFFSMH